MGRFFSRQRDTRRRSGCDLHDVIRADGYPLDEGQRWQLARFISAQLTRGPQIRENLSKFMVETVRHAVALAAQHYTDEQWIATIGEIPSAEFKRQALNSEARFNIVPTNAGLLDALLANVEEVAALLMPRSWTLVRFGTPCLFTSKQPVIYINPSGHRLGYGVGTADQSYLPVSTTHGLVLSNPWARWPTALVDGTEELARRLNWAVLSFPTSEELVLNPDIKNHPLPGPAVLAAGRSPALDDEIDGEMPEHWQRLVVGEAAAPIAAQSGDLGSP